MSILFEFFLRYDLLPRFAVCVVVCCDVFCFVICRVVCFFAVGCQLHFESWNNVIFLEWKLNGVK